MFVNNVSLQVILLPKSTEIPSRQCYCRTLGYLLSSFFFNEIITLIDIFIFECSCHIDK